MPPRVMMVIPNYHPIVGGAEIQAQRLAEALVGRGIDVSVLTGRYRGLAGEETVNGVRVRRVRFLDGLRLVPMQLYLQALGMRRVLRQRCEDYDIVHCHQGLWTAWAAAKAAERWRKPCLVKFANVGDRFDLRVLGSCLPGGRAMARYVVYHIDRAVAISGAVAEELRAAGFASGRIARIPNGAPLPAWPRARPRAVRDMLGMSGDAPLILYVARLEPHKRPLDVLEAFARIRRDHPAARLVFLGDGSLRGELARRTEAAGLAAAVHMPGNVDNVADYLAEGDVFMLPSEVEGLSNALLEAMAHGLACIVTPAGGNADLILSGQTGLLAPVGDVAGLGDMLARLLNNPAERQRLGAAARGLVEREYGLDRVADQYLALYEDLMRGRGGRALECGLQ